REMATQAQIQALQAQINPHFLFNCLNLLNSLIRTDAESARQLMQKLATVFRYTLDSTCKELVSLQEEIDFVKNYLEIAKARFGERLSISIAVSPETTTLPVLPMLLQPLVENSLHHAIEPKVGNAKLAVSASIQDNKLKIEVVDDGVGIDSKELTRLQNGLLLTPTSSHTRLSLKNISERLRINYDCDLKIESQQGHGTNVTILIDLKKLKYKEKSL
ncbi:MAG: histidine kinase, partial [Blastocatellia bacterium]|nr:histidine kinase [Blastocatellia bacterium]